MNHREDLSSFSEGVITKGHRFVVHENDVLSGRGVHIAHHPGNERFRTLVNSRKDETYLTVYTTSEKRAVALEIIKHVKQLDPPGRFLKREGRGHASRGLSGPWEILSDKETLKKTCQALRDCNRADRVGYAACVPPPKDVIQNWTKRDSSAFTREHAAEAVTEAATSVKSLKRSRGKKDDLSPSRQTKGVGSTYFSATKNHMNQSSYLNANMNMNMNMNMLNLNFDQNIMRNKNARINMIGMNTNVNSSENMGTHNHGIVNINRYGKNNAALANPSLGTISTPTIDFNAGLVNSSNYHFTGMQLPQNGVTNQYIQGSSLNQEGNANVENTSQYSSFQQNLANFNQGKNQYASTMYPVISKMNDNANSNLYKANAFSKDIQSSSSNSNSYGLVHAGEHNQREFIMNRQSNNPNNASFPVSMGTSSNGTFHQNIGMQPQYIYNSSQLSSIGINNFNQNPQSIHSAPMMLPLPPNSNMNSTSNVGLMFPTQNPSKGMVEGTVYPTNFQDKNTENANGA